MSIYKINCGNKKYDIAVGWDGGLHMFFGQVIHLGPKNKELASFHCRSLEELEFQMKDYVEIPKITKDSIIEDHKKRSGQTPLQILARSMLLERAGHT